MSKGGELLSQGEIVEDECLSQACHGATGPEGELEEKQHRRTMRADLCDSKGKGRDRRVVGRGRSSVQGAAHGVLARHR